MRLFLWLRLVFIRVLLSGFNTLANGLWKELGPCVRPGWRTVCVAAAPLQPQSPTLVPAGCAGRCQPTRCRFGLSRPVPESCREDVALHGSIAEPLCPMGEVLLGIPGGSDVV